MDSACWVCFCCRRSTVYDMNVGIFRLGAMECMFAHTRPRFILSSKGVFREWSQNPCQLQGKNPLYWKSSPQRRIEPTTLHHAGGLSQHTTSKLFQPLCQGLIELRSLDSHWLQRQSGSSCGDLSHLNIFEGR